MNSELQGLASLRCNIFFINFCIGNAISLDHPIIVLYTIATYSAFCLILPMLVLSTGARGYDGSHRGLLSSEPSTRDGGKLACLSRYTHLRISHFIQGSR